MRTLYLFFPLWLGLVLLLDGWMLIRTGSSIASRSKGHFLSLFLFSVPIWWVFEMLNLRTRNWEYRGDVVQNEWLFLMSAALAFSTVVPAVLEAAEVVRSFRWIGRLPHGPQLRPTARNAGILFLAGSAMLILLLVKPKFFYCFAWTSLYCLMDAVNIWRGSPSLLTYTARGDWRPVLALGLGGLGCGFLWEMWNSCSYPKWVYHTPGVQRLHVFEMPLLGYLGYIPFAWEIHALHSFLWPRAPSLRL
jgi:hypothetical protein